MENKEITMYELIGLIKDDKAPNKIKIDNNIWFFYIKSDGTVSYIENEPSYCKRCSLNFNYYIENNKLNDPVKILSEDDYEWEDIEDLGMVYSDNVEEEIMRNRYIIRQLIKNQKYLKERLDKDEK